MCLLGFILHEKRSSSILRLSEKTPKHRSEHPVCASGKETLPTLPSPQRAISGSGYVHGELEISIRFINKPEGAHTVAPRFKG